MGTTFTDICAIVKRIPAGRVASYGGVARMFGNPRLSRVVGYAMRGCTDGSVPCHRVVHADGRLAEAFGVGGNSVQRAMLLAEGAPFLPDGRVDMARCEWRGDAEHVTRGTESAGI